MMQDPSEAPDCGAQQGNFRVVARRRHGRITYMLTLEGTAPQTGGDLIWLFARKPPLKPGIKRIAAALEATPRADAAELWDEGPCTLRTAGDAWFFDFGGRKLFGPYRATAQPRDHWLLAAGAQPPRDRFALSAGGVVMRRSTTHALEICLIRPRKRRYWTLPKGTVEADETISAAALREVHEETGVRATIERVLDPIEYWFWVRTDNGRERIHKTVAYYLMHAQAFEEHTAKREIAAVRWVPVAEINRYVSHDSERSVIGQALAAAGVQPTHA